ncbi:TCF3 fusion partner [Erpetoichthys calabaricus]|uniref:TCF3 (E2A) fusion partner n=1 Tax=Erpetoichthys calabaricus TaxID=27687 RepID=A0A8C4SYZ3_ERPCA|nr:TCF3 fusion partner [Erpetoichthys calabaricus]
MMDDFSDLTLPPLFGGHILEAELETEGVEFVDAGGVSENQVDEWKEKQKRETDRQKYLSLSRRCREIEQVNERILHRLHQVQKLTRQLKKERRFLMKTLNAYGDDYRSAQLAIPLEEEVSCMTDPSHCMDGECLDEPSASSPSGLLQSTPIIKRKRHRGLKDRERDLLDGDVPNLSDSAFTGYCGESPATDFT